MPSSSPEKPRVLRRCLSCESQVSDRATRSRSAGFAYKNAVVRTDARKVLAAYKAIAPRTSRAHLILPRIPHDEVQKLAD